MGLIQDRWNDQQCRTEDGIFFGNDEYIPINGSSETGYCLETRASISKIIRLAPDAWSDLVETVTSGSASLDLSIHAGETSWEGEGFLAVVSTSTGKLLWLLHLSTSEPFIEVRMEGEIIRAVSDGYPTRFTWSIPIHTPEEFTLDKIDSD